MNPQLDAHSVRSTLTTAHGSTVTYYSLPALGAAYGADIARLPVTVKILLENLARQSDGGIATAADVERLARWQPNSGQNLSSHSCPPAWCCKISPVYRPSWTWRRCARPWPV